MELKAVVHKRWKVHVEGDSLSHIDNKKMTMEITSKATNGSWIVPFEFSSWRYRIATVLEQVHMAERPPGYEINKY